MNQDDPLEQRWNRFNYKKLFVVKVINTIRWVVLYPSILLPSALVICHFFTDYN